MKKLSYKEVQVEIYETKGMIIVEVFQIKENGGSYHNHMFQSILWFAAWLVRQPWYNDSHTLSDIRKWLPNSPLF